MAKEIFENLFCDKIHLQHIMTMCLRISQNILACEIVGLQYSEYFKIKRTYSNVRLNTDKWLAFTLT